MAQVEDKRYLISDREGVVVFFQHSGRADGWLAGSIELLAENHEVTQAALRQASPKRLDSIRGIGYFALRVDVEKIVEEVNGGRKLVLKAETVINNRYLLADQTQAGLLMLNQVQAMQHRRKG